MTVDIEDYDVGPMSWDRARDLARRRSAIGAHSLRHAILTSETEASALFDIEQSIAEAPSKIGDSYKSFAFPNGNYRELLARQALEARAQTVMTTDPMWAGSSFPP